MNWTVPNLSLLPPLLPSRISSLGVRGCFPSHPGEVSDSFSPGKEENHPGPKKIGRSMPELVALH